MKHVENLNAPSLNGWIIAVGMGVIAFVVSKVVGGFDYTTSGFFAAVVTGVAGLVMGMPWGAKDRIARPEGEAEAHPAPVAEAAAAVPMAAPVAAATVVEMPVATATPAASVPVAPAAAPVAEIPVAVAPAAGEVKPAGLAAPRGGAADDLKILEGVGPAMEKLLNEHGVFHIDQIAGWGPAEVAWMDGNLKGFKGRVTRDKWVAQAKLIGEVGVEEFLRRAKTNDY